MPRYPNQPEPLATRIRDAWHVLRQGLPVATVTHEFRRTGCGGIVRVGVRYRGRCFGFIDGRETWSVNGSFTVEQPITLSIDGPG